VIAVIGAGPAGLSAAALLQRDGRQVVLLDRAPVGGVWAGRYDRLHLHTARALSGLPGYPIPRSFGKWPARDDVVEYLRRYAAHHRLDVRTPVDVLRVEREGDGWVVQTSDGPVACGRVVVAAGLSNVPFTPDWPGRFDGALCHSSGYRNASRFRAQRVVVVGTGNSGAEIAVDLAEGGAREVLLSVRTQPGLVRRDALGVPSQLLGIASSRLPVAIVDRIAAAMRRLAFRDLDRYGLVAPERPYSEFLQRRVIPIVDVGLAGALRSGRVRVVAAVDGLDGRAVVLADGSRVEVDAVVAATGFRTGLEPLVGHLGLLDERGRPSEGDVESPRGAPGLHFVGYEVSLGGTFRLVAGEAERLARLVAATA
jgi:putative flavoprotein involved in K+ transport